MRVYIYIEREKEREIDRERDRERERDHTVSYVYDMYKRVTYGGVNRIRRNGARTMAATAARRGQGGVSRCFLYYLVFSGSGL